METRMEKYYQEDLSNLKRSKKNQQLYQEVYGSYNDLDNLEVPMNTNEIDLTEIKTMVNSRDDYRKVKEYENILNKQVTPNPKPQESVEKQPKIYDINELLAHAKNENIKPQEERPSNSNYLEALKVEAAMLKEKNDIETYIPPKEEGVSTESLPLDILSDLKPDEDTTVSAPIVEQTESIEVKQELKKMTNETGNTFYSGSYKFSKSDFVDNNGINASSKLGIFFKIILLIIGLCVLGCGIFYIVVTKVIG